MCRNIVVYHMGLITVVWVKSPSILKNGASAPLFLFIGQLQFYTAVLLHAFFIRPQFSWM